MLKNKVYDIGIPYIALAVLGYCPSISQNTLYLL